jgi:hypothetical protein
MAARMVENLLMHSILATLRTHRQKLRSTRRHTPARTLAIRLDMRMMDVQTFVFGCTFAYTLYSNAYSSTQQSTCVCNHLCVGTFDEASRGKE